MMREIFPKAKSLILQGSVFVWKVDDVACFAYARAFFVNTRGNQ
jgi:hypothetical protein